MAICSISNNKTESKKEVTGPSQIISEGSYFRCATKPFKFFTRESGVIVYVEKDVIVVLHFFFLNISPRPLIIRIKTLAWPSYFPAKICCTHFSFTCYEKPGSNNHVSPGWHDCLFNMHTMECPCPCWVQHFFNHYVISRYHRSRTIEWQHCLSRLLCFEWSYEAIGSGRAKEKDGFAVTFVGWCSSSVYICYS